MKNKYKNGAHVSMRKMRLVLHCFSEDVPALNAAAIACLNRNTTQSIYRRLRMRIIALTCAEMKHFAGEIEIDESYFGARRVRGKRGRGASGKIPVVGLHKREGRVFVSVVENCSAKQLLPIIKGHILEGSDIYTDGWKAYDGLVTKGYQHHRIHHHKNQFARGRNHVNGIESFWAFSKHHFIKLKGVRKTTFLTHLKESEWRFNHRCENLFALLCKLLRNDPL
jgi:transposase-like protein